jgi:probable selenium-dependent hydroxylase accessory protein YqeC
MTACEALQIDPGKPCLVSLVGAGGKTSSMFMIARELASSGRKVLVTTTTNIALEESSRADRLVIHKAPSKNVIPAKAGIHNPLKLLDSRFHGSDKLGIISGCDKFQTFGSLANTAPGTIVCLGSGILPEKKKLIGVDREFPGLLFRNNLFDHILVEADGSKRRPIKAPADYEPVIPAETTLTIGVIGLDALGKPITEEHVHRPECFCSVTEQKMGDIIDRQSLVKLIVSDRGLFKGVPSGSSRYVLFNKADSDEAVKEAKSTVEALIKIQAHVDGFVIASTGKGSIYSARQGDSLW